VLVLIAMTHVLHATKTQPLASPVPMVTISPMMMTRPASNYQLVALKSAAEDALTATLMKAHAMPAQTTTTYSRTALMPLNVSEIALLVTQLLTAPTNANNAKSPTAAHAQPTDNALLASMDTS